MDRPLPDGKLICHRSIIGGVVGYWALIDMLFVGNRRVVGLLAWSRHYIHSWQRRSRDSRWVGRLMRAIVDAILLVTLFEQCWLIYKRISRLIGNTSVANGAANRSSKKLCC